MTSDRVTSLTYYVYLDIFVTDFFVVAVLNVCLNQDVRLGDYKGLSEKQFISRGVNLLY